MIKKETDRQNYNILAGEGDILRILKEIDKAENRESIGAGIQKLLEVLGNYGNADQTYLFENQGYVLQSYRYSLCWHSFLHVLFVQYRCDDTQRALPILLD